MTPETTIIDLHCHVAGIGAGGSGCFISGRMRRSWRYGVFLKAFGVTEEDLKREGDAVVVRQISRGVARSRRVTGAVVLALDCVVSPDGEEDRSLTEMCIPNDFLAAEVRRYPNLFFAASVHPYRRDALERLERAVADGAVLLKWLPSIQRMDPADPRLVPFYRRVQKLSLPLLIHTGSESSFTRKANVLGDPERLRLPLSLGVKVVAAHAGSNGRNAGEPNHERFFRLAAEFPNLYADISALTQLNRMGQLPRLLKHPELYDRLLYGTDMPLPDTAAVSPYYYAFRLSPRQMREISAEKNPWDRDVLLKEALGVPQEVLGSSARFLNLHR